MVTWQQLLGQPLGRLFGLGHHTLCQLLSEELSKLLGIVLAASSPAGHTLALVVVMDCWVLLHFLLIAEHLVGCAINHSEAHGLAQKRSVELPLPVQAHLVKGQLQVLARLPPVRAEAHNPVLRELRCEDVPDKSLRVQTQGIPVAGFGYWLLGWLSLLDAHLILLLRRSHQQNGRGEKAAQARNAKTHCNGHGGHPSDRWDCRSEGCGGKQVEGKGVMVPNGSLAA
mmetsp:Transcript_61352/g.142790  ORF Transcript_61352/g.142790 Transcript_61352/m.142790 type:complete len:227 (-) Transcript_61352:17-697(-)